MTSAAYGVGRNFAAEGASESSRHRPFERDERSAPFEGIGRSLNWASAEEGDTLLLIRRPDSATASVGSVRVRDPQTATATDGRGGVRAGVPTTQERWIMITLSGEAVARSSHERGRKVQGRCWRGSRRWRPHG